MAGQVETGAWTREEPWHGLGTQVPGIMTAQEALRLGGLDWDVALQQIGTRSGDGRWSAFENKWATVRTTDGAQYGIFSERYEPAQNRDALKLLDRIVGSDDAKYDAVWSLKGGAVVAATARMDDIKPAEGEEIRTYVSVVNSHDGSHPVRIMITPIRVVCMNTLMAALGKVKAGWTRRHTANWNSEPSIEEARQTLDLVRVYQTNLESTARELLGQVWDTSKMEQLGKSILGFPVDEEASPQKESKLESLIDLYKGSPNLGNIRDTAWGGYQAAVEWLDYETSYRDGKNATAAENRCMAIIGGKSYDTKTSALELVQGIAV